IRSGFGQDYELGGRPIHDVRRLRHPLRSRQIKTAPFPSGSIVLAPCFRGTAPSLKDSSYRCVTIRQIRPAGIRSTFGRIFATVPKPSHLFPACPLHYSADGEGLAGWT